MNTLSADQSEDPTFIHSRVDDLGLSMSEFRVYCHLKRRANHGVSWPGIDSIAAVCRMHKMTAVKSIKGLEKRGMVVVTRVEGEGNRYRLTKPSAWKEQSKRDNANQSKIDNGTSIKEITDPCISDNVRVSIEGNPIEGVHPLPPQGGNGHFVPLSTFRKTFTLKPSEQFLEFWEAYPRREAMKAAVAAWEKAHPKLDEVLDALAKAKKQPGWQRGRQYIPLPATWINGERWDDEL